MTDDEEFELVRAAIVESTEKLAVAIEKHGSGQWDYMIVAVPSGRPFTRIGLMSSMQPEQLPLFLKWLGDQMAACAKRGAILTDQVGAEKPS